MKDCCHLKEAGWLRISSSINEIRITNNDFEVKNLNVKTNELEDRVIDFAVLIVDIVEDVKKNYTGNYYGNQLIRSSRSTALNYGEARSGESPKEFVHKLGVSLKELGKSYNCLRIIGKARLYQGDQMTIDEVSDENNQLISIFVASLKTTIQNSEIVNRC